MIGVTAMDGGAPGPGKGRERSFPVSLFDNTQLGLERAIEGAGMRQQILANNLANAETPGFRRSDLDFHTTLAQAMQSGDSSAIESAQFTPQQEQTTMRADGNGIDVDVESADMAKNALDYQALVSVSRARIDNLKSAMGGGV
jgi:flagellar basal-body rod protein FlgB